MQNAVRNDAWKKGGECGIADRKKMILGIQNVVPDERNFNQKIKDSSSGRDVLYATM